MKRVFAVLGIMVMGMIGGSRALALEAEQVRTTIKRVGDWQLANPVEFGTLHWAVAPLLDGLIDLSLTTGDAKYLAAVVRAGTREGWRPGPNVYHADDLAAGHAWTRIYMMDPRRVERLAPFKQRVDDILAKPILENFSFSADPRTPGVRNTDRWTWVDALYMAPPAFAALARATGDRRYLRFVDGEFKPVLETLYDPQEKLFYRDDRFIGLRTPNGEKVFWSRGNGWVFAGLPLLLNHMPPDHPTREFYVGRGLLDRAVYWPAAERGWNALVAQISRRGAVGSVQPIGAEPAGFGPASSVAYGTGAVLMAGSEILRTIGGASTVEPAELIAQAEMLVGVPDISRQGLTFNSPLFDREYAVDVLTKIAAPVLEALSKGELKQRMPIHDWEKHRAAWTHYEAFARTLAGIAPWLELGPDNSPEGRLRARFIDLARKSLINATDPASPDYMNFGQVPDQPLVESAYLASALLAAPKQLWEPLTEEQRRKVADALRISRTVPLTHDNNWVLFPAMIEAALWRYAGDVQLAAIERAVWMFENEWYLGDGIYGDGPDFHADYYNSYVIHPMLLEVIRVAREKGHPRAERWLPVALERAGRYATILERQISPEGTFPVMGRSAAYRFAAFYHLAYMALNKKLPDAVSPGAARAGISNVVLRMVEAPETFDKDGWLTLGAVGFQPGLREQYNATGSLYVCLTGLVHLGLPADDPFWTTAPHPWTQRRIWSGDDVPRDKALE